MGRNKKPFNFARFGTKLVASHLESPVSFTIFGFSEKTKVGELSQLTNALKGEMSSVSLRPNFSIKKD